MRSHWRRWFEVLRQSKLGDLGGTAEAIEQREGSPPNPAAPELHREPDAMGRRRFVAKLLVLALALLLARIAFYLASEDSATADPTTSEPLSFFAYYWALFLEWPSILYQSADKIRTTIDVLIIAGVAIGFGTRARKPDELMSQPVVLGTALLLLVIYGIAVANHEMVYAEADRIADSQNVNEHPGFVPIKDSWKRIFDDIERERDAAMQTSELTRLLGTTVYEWHSVEIDESSSVESVTVGKKCPSDYCLTIKISTNMDRSVRRDARVLFALTGGRWGNITIPEGTTVEPDRGIPVEVGSSWFIGQPGGSVCIVVAEATPNRARLIVGVVPPSIDQMIGHMECQRPKQSASDTQ